MVVQKQNTKEIIKINNKSLKRKEMLFFFKYKGAGFFLMFQLARGQPAVSNLSAHQSRYTV